MESSTFLGLKEGTDIQSLGIEDLKRLLSRMGHLLSNVEDFVTARVEQIIEQSSASGTAATEPSGTSVKQLMAAREAWERERETQVNQLQRDQELLAQAWQRLEAEERRLIGQRNERKVVAAKSVESTPAASPAVTAMEEKVDDRANTKNNELMMLQYQQLRREMQKHSQRGRR